MRVRHLGMGVVMVVVWASVGWGAPQQAPASTAPGSHLVTFTGVLKDADGNPRTGAVPMTFSLYAVPEDGEALWAEQQTVVADAAGRYSVLLGSTLGGGLPAEVFGDGKAQWLAAQVVGDVEPARVLLVAVPYALKAADADTLAGKTVTSFVLTENLAKAIQEQVATGAISGAATTSSIGGTVQLGHETDSNTWFGLNAAHAGPSAVSPNGYNAFFGELAGYATTTGCCNTFLGRGAGQQNTTGHENTFLGNQAGGNGVSTSDNTFVGRNAGFSNTADQNTFVGYYAGSSNTSGTENTLIGHFAGLSVVTGTGGTYLGFQAGKLATASSNTMIGANAGASTSSGAANVFVGRLAAEKNTGGGSNVAVGTYAGRENTSGDSNVFLGYSAGDTNTAGFWNTYLGGYADGSASLSNSSAVGFRAMVTQSNSLILGGITGINSGTDTNVGIGTTAPAARLHVGNGEVRFANGNGTSTHFNYLDTSINYVRGITYFDGASAYFTGGNLGIGTTSPVAKLHVTGGEVRLMNGSGEHTHLNYGNLSTNYIRGVTYFDTASVYFTGGNVGIGTTSPSYKLHVVGDIYTTGTYQGSDLRLKKNVQNLGYGLDTVMRLRPVSYEWKDRPTGSATFGLIAQEVATIMPELVGTSQDEAGMLSLNYVGLVPVLVRAVQELQAQNTDMKAQIAELRVLVLQLSAEKQR
jgi:trimeric autotransporter adhesin